MYIIGYSASDIKSVQRKRITSRMNESSQEKNLFWYYLG